MLNERISVGWFCNKFVEEKLNNDRLQEFYDCLNTLAKYNLEYRSTHRRYQEKVRWVLDDIEDKLDALEMKNKQMIVELRIIQNECHKIKDSLKGSSKDKEKDPKNEVEVYVGPRKENKDKLQAFFDRFDPKLRGLEKKEQIKKLHNQKQIVKDWFAVYRKFPLYYLKQLKGMHFLIKM